MDYISISIVTYNNENSIKKTITSIMKNIDNKLKYKIYIIDNNSKDNTLEEIYKIKNTNIEIIKNNKNVGFGTAHNQIINIINSKYHIVVNPDITISTSVINDMAYFMNKNPHIGLLSPLIKHPDGRIQYLCKKNPSFLDLSIRLLFPRFFKKRQRYFTMMDTGYDKIFKIEYASGCFMFFRTEILKKINGFDENIFLYLEDADITRRVNQISSTYFFPYNYVVHEWQRGSHKNIKLMIINLKSAFYYFKKWGFKLY